MSYKSQLTSKSSVERNGDHIYYNVNLANPTSDFMIANYSDIRTSPLLPDGSLSKQFNLSVVRFKVPVSAIPVFFFIPQPGSPTSGNLDPNLGIYSITFSYGGSDKQVFLEHTPIIPNDSIFVPISWPSITQQNYLYYGVFSYQQFVDNINTALATAYNYCIHNAPFNTSPPVLANAPAPFMVFDPDTQIFTIVAHRTFDPIFAGGPTIQFFMNIFLFSFFQNFQYRYRTTNTVTNGKDIQIFIKNDGNNLSTEFTPSVLFTSWVSTNTYNVNDAVSYLGINYLSLTPANIGNQPNTHPANWAAQPGPIPPPDWSSGTAYVPGNVVFYQGFFYINTLAVAGSLPPPSDFSNWNVYTGFDFYQMSQEFSSIYLWSIFSTIIFISGTLPIQNEYIPSTSLTGTGTGNISSSFRPILTDFEPSISNASDNRSYLQYYPQGPYRMIDMVGNNNITVLDLQVFWQDNQLNLYPLLIPPNEILTAKILFQKKDVYYNNEQIIS